MQIKNLPKLLEAIDLLIEQCRPAGPVEASVVMGPKVDDVEEVLEFGDYPPDDPTSVPRRALLAIGQTLGAVGGPRLLKQVYDAYEAKYGHHKAARLSQRWDTAVGAWYD